MVSFTVQAREPAEDNPLYKDPYYRQFFGNRASAERQVLADGSGVIIDAERGLVLTKQPRREDSRADRRRVVGWKAH